MQELKDEITKDSFIDKLHLESEALKISTLYSKWIGRLAEETRKLRSVQIHYDKKILERTQYYMGKASDEVYKAEPLQLKVLKQDLPLYLNADDAMNDVKSLLNEQTIKVNMIELFMKELSQRSFNIKNNIDYQKFKAGL